MDRRYSRLDNARPTSQLQRATAIVAQRLLIETVKYRRLTSSGQPTRPSRTRGRRMLYSSERPTSSSGPTGSIKGSTTLISTRPTSLFDSTLNEFERVSLRWSRTLQPCSTQLESKLGYSQLKILSCAWITPTPIMPVRRDHQEMVEVTMNLPAAVATKAISHRTTTATPVAVNRPTRMVMMGTLHPSSMSPALVPRGGRSRVS